MLLYCLSQLDWWWSISISSVAALSIYVGALCIWCLLHLYSLWKCSVHWLLTKLVLCDFGTNFNDTHSICAHALTVHSISAPHFKVAHSVGAVWIWYLLHWLSLHWFLTLWVLTPGVLTPLVLRSISYSIITYSVGAVWIWYFLHWLSLHMCLTLLVLTPLVQWSITLLVLTPGVSLHWFFLLHSYPISWCCVNIVLASLAFTPLVLWSVCAYCWVWSLSAMFWSTAWAETPQMCPSFTSREDSTEFWVTPAQGT